MRHQGIVALVTGASRGIGLEVCRQLVDRGATVLLTARSHAKARAATATITSTSGRVQPLELDVTSAASAAALVSEVERAYGRLDVLVNNAATVADWNETASRADLAIAHAVFEANVFGPWRATQALLPLLRRAPAARIVNVASGAGSHGDAQFGLATGAGVASYGISKAALCALTTKLAVELRADGILVNAVCPGLTATAPGMEAMGARPVADGAAGIVWAATLPADGPTGGFFRDERPLPW